MDAEAGEASAGRGEEGGPPRWGDNRDQGRGEHAHRAGELALSPVLPAVRDAGRADTEAGAGLRGSKGPNSSVEE